MWKRLRRVWAEGGGGVGDWNVVLEFNLEAVVVGGDGKGIGLGVFWDDYFEVSV